MSTPSESIRTATIQGSVLPAKAPMRPEAPGSSDTTTTGRTPTRLRISSAMPRGSMTAPEMPCAQRPVWPRRLAASTARAGGTVSGTACTALTGTT